MKIKIKKSDTVQIISGKDKGKTAKVLKVFPKDERILVESVALRKRHRRPRKEREKGQVVISPSPIHISNALLFCKTCSRGVRTGYQILDDSSKVRICKKCKGDI